MQDMANRIRKQTNVTLDPELVAALDAWIDRQPIRMGRSGVIEAAIRAWLEANDEPKGKKR